MHEIKAQGETRTWAWLGAMIGLTIFGLIALAVTLMYENETIALPWGMEAAATAPLVAKIGIPIILLVFGAGAGAMIGNGTPRYNEHPEQGRGHAYHFLRGRRRRTTSVNSI